MQYILSLLPLLACPVGMGLMMWFMMRSMQDEGKKIVSPSAQTSQLQDSELTEEDTLHESSNSR